MSDIADGTYKAKAVDWALGETKAGKPQIAVTFQLTGEGAPRITYYGSFSDAAYEYTVQRLRVCGWTGDDLTQLDSIGTHEVELVIKADTYEGKTRAKVQFINRPGEGGGLKSKMTEASAREFAAVMKAKIAALGKVPAAKPEISSDIPF